MANFGPGSPRQSVLVVAQFYWPELIGSAPYCTEAAEWFAARGAQVDVLAARPHYPSAAGFPEYLNGARDREIVAGCRIARVSVRERRGSGAKARILSELSFLLGGLRLLAMRQVPRRDRVVAFCPSMLSLLLGRVACKRSGRLVGVVHDIQSGLADGLGMGAGGLVRGMRLAERLLFNRCDALIVLSDSMRRELCGLGVTRPIHVVPIWTDTHEIQPLDRPGGAPPTALYSGNFGRKQGLDQVLAMAPILRAEVPDVRIVLRGDGSEKARLEETAREEGLTHVRFEPLAAREKFAAALADGDVHLVPQDPSGSNYAVPSKIYSILAAGRPFVCTAQPGSGLSDLAQETRAFECCAAR